MRACHRWSALQSRGFTVQETTYHDANQRIPNQHTTTSSLVQRLASADEETASDATTYIDISILRDRSVDWDQSNGVEILGHLPSVII